jgi:hypothetical protein
MSPGIYSIDDQGQLVEMSEQPYPTEDALQSLLEQHPELLADDQPAGERRRLVLVAREAGLASEEDGALRWSVDHLFLDEEAVPTLVEVKRSSDTRIRREVVGQMLDYAANAILYWPIENLRTSFEETCANHGDSPEDRLAELLGPQADQEAFWQAAKTNLLAGRIRMIFVADQIPTELQRIVEFLNGQMASAEVLALELRQYVGEGQRALVPRIFGQTASAGRAKSAGRQARQWDEDSFFADVEERRGREEAQVARAVFDWAGENDQRIFFGSGQTVGSFYPIVDYGGQRYWGISVWTDGRAACDFSSLRNRPPFDSESKRLELLERLNGIPGVPQAPRDKINGVQKIPLSALRDKPALESFFEVLLWFKDEVLRGSPADEGESPEPNPSSLG